MTERKLISFDVFDTAIFRKVYKPWDIFGLLGEEFKAARAEAEKDLWKSIPFYNIFDIYKKIPQYDVHAEIQAELDNCIPNPKILDIYNSNKDDYIFISDMYLPQHYIEEMLKKCGYKNPRVFVSCDCKAGKSDGKLFKRVEQILMRKIDTHYGDNIWADIRGARSCGIKTQFCPALHDLESITPQLSNSKLQKIMVNSEFESKNEHLKIADIYAPLMYNFTKWVLDKRKGNQKIFFNARDGFVPYLIAKYIFKADNIYYTHISRKCVHYCNIDFTKDLTDPVNNCYLDRLKYQRASTIHGFLGSINYPNPEKYKDKKLEEGELLDFVLGNQTDLYRHWKKCKRYALTYLKSLNMHDDDIFVDIGYYCSIQKEIEQLLGIKMQGKYVQLFPGGFDVNKEQYFSRNILVYAFVAEAVFCSPEHSTVGYNSLGKPMFVYDSIERRKQSAIYMHEIMKMCKKFQSENINITLNDTELLLIRYLFYPTVAEAKANNECKYENGDAKQYYSVVNFNLDDIITGNVEDAYKKSYWGVGYKVLLDQEKNYKQLKKLLPD